MKTKSDQIRFFIFKEKGAKVYTGVCLDFGIVLEGNDPVELRFELEKSAHGYLKTIIREKMDIGLLRDQAEKKYFKIYHRLLEAQSARERSGETKKFDEILTGIISINACKAYT